MQSDPSVHDNFVYSFTVDCEQGRLELHTAYRDREPHEFTDIVFRDVVAHRFEHVLKQNILMDVEETDVETLVQMNDTLFSESWRWGWPPVEYRGDLQTLVRLLKASGIRAYAVQGSCGMSGWVLAGACDRVRREGPRE